MRRIAMSARRPSLRPTLGIVSVVAHTTFMSACSTTVAGYITSALSGLSLSSDRRPSKSSTSSAAPRPVDVVYVGEGGRPLAGPPSVQVAYRLHVAARADEEAQEVVPEQAHDPGARLGRQILDHPREPFLSGPLVGEHLEHPHRAQRVAAAVDQQSVRHEGDLDASSSDVDQHPLSGLDAQLPRYGQVYQPGLFGAAYDGHLYAGPFSDSTDQVPAVFGLPHRARRDPGRVIDIPVRDRVAEAVEGLDSPVDNRGREAAGRKDVPSEPYRLTLSIDDVDLAVCQDIADGQTHRVGANVDGGKSCQRLSCIRGWWGRSSAVSWTRARSESVYQQPTSPFNRAVLRSLGRAGMGDQAM